MNDLERIARDIVFGGNLSNADAVLLWEALTGFMVLQARRCEACEAEGFTYVSDPRYVPHLSHCVPCHGTGYVGGFTPRDAEAQVAAMVEAVKGGGG